MRNNASMTDGNRNQHCSSSIVIFSHHKKQAGKQTDCTRIISILFGFSSFGGIQLTIQVFPVVILRVSLSPHIPPPPLLNNIYTSPSLPGIPVPVIRSMTNRFSFFFLVFCLSISSLPPPPLPAVV